MTAPYLTEWVGEMLVFAGNSLSMFLMSVRRYSFRMSLALWMGVFGGSSLLALANHLWTPTSSSLWNQLLALGLCAMVFLLTSRGNFLRNLFIFTTYINVLLFSIAVSQALATNFVGSDPVAVMEFRLILISLFCLVLVYDIRPAFLRAADSIPRGWGALTVLTCIFCSCLLVMAVITNLFRDIPSQTLILLVVFFVIMVSSYIVIFKMIGALSRENRKRQLEIEKKFLSNQLSSYEQLERESRKYRHDFRHHNLLILEYAKNRDCDAIIHYLQEYETAAENKLEWKFCENMTVNSIVSAFYRQAAEQGVHMRIDIRMRKETAVRDTDLVSILANLLENAVKGSLLSQEEHWVELSIVHKGKKLSIQCRNSCAGNIHFSDGLPQAVGRTGIGVTSIADTAAAYSGDTVFSAENGVFTSRILLNDWTEDC